MTGQMLPELLMSVARIFPQLFFVIIDVLFENSFSFEKFTEIEYCIYRNHLYAKNKNEFNYLLKSSRFTVDRYTTSLITGGWE